MAMTRATCVDLVRDVERKFLQVCPTSMLWALLNASNVSSGLEPTMEMGIFG